jgi:potassium-transporting ATPase KdpC subunit
MWSRLELPSLHRPLGSSMPLTVVAAVAVGLAYPAVMWGIGQVAFRDKADGSNPLLLGLHRRTRCQRAQPDRGLGPALTVTV